ncbi:hypothetical protein [Corallococcus sp. EGB]|uniref:hypothetical protein n=1 Tax=Corallococcus sp. EGB TaxID=1521117 RepID=UPI001CBC690D|nr:hypothetical protein [Corallococcus sp. EGB]
MLRTLALVSAAALSLFSAACGGEEVGAGPSEEELKDTRASVTGTRPAVMVLTAQATDETESFHLTLELSAVAKSRDGLRVSLSPFDCDLTATMTGESTFTVNPGTCHLLIPPQDGRFACVIDLAITTGTGGRETADSEVGLSFTADYRRDCADYRTPFTSTVLVTVVGA